MNLFIEDLRKRSENQRLLEIEVSQLKEEYQQTIDTLQQIEDAQSPTNAQVIAAVKFLAKTMRLLLKLLARQYT